jgi:hypothetical protein
MYGKEQCRKKKQRTVNCVKLMLIIYIKKVVMKHPCMTMCWATNGTVIRTRYEKWEEPPEGGGGGMGEGVRRVKE